MTHLLQNTVANVSPIFWIRHYLQLPFRQWVAGNVYHLVMSNWMVNIAENLIAVMGFRGVSSFLKWGGQVVIQVVMQRSTATRSAFYSAKSGGQLPTPPLLTPLGLLICSGSAWLKTQIWVKWVSPFCRKIGL